MGITELLRSGGQAVVSEGVETKDCEEICEEGEDSTMAESLDQLLNAELREAFDEFDKDGSGSISTKELLGVMRSMGQNPTEDEVLELVMEVDLNGDGTIDFPEFLQMMKKKSSEQDQLDDLKEAFRMFDTNKDGFIDLNELKKVTSLIGTSLTTADLYKFMAEADKDGNGKIDYNEFVAMMKQY